MEQFIESFYMKLVKRLTNPVEIHTFAPEKGKKYFYDKRRSRV